MNLPKHHTSGDSVWIQEQLNTIASIQHPRLASQIAEKYSETYQQKLMQMGDCGTAQNKARREANTRLRVYVEKLQAKVIRPNTI